MKLIKLFSDFLNDTVNLNRNRIDLLEQSVTALKNYVRASEWKPKILRFEEQGSWAHETIIKPVDGDEFDADLLVMVSPVDGWSAADYVAELGKIFTGDALYGDKPRVFDYCVTITYAGQRKVDLAPCVVGRVVPDQIEVCNRSANKFERSEPTAYTAWLRERNGYSGGNSFRKVTRLLKYLRDIKTRFTCQSVLLTTLIGFRIDWFDKDSDDFLDTPSALQTILGRLDDWLQARPNRPRVDNPKLTSEDLGALWDQTQYANFRTFIHKYRGWVDEAIASTTRDDSIQKWRRVFGDEFAKGAELTVQKKDNILVEIAKSLMLSTAEHKNDLVEWVRDFGLSILPPEFSRPGHMKQPPWPSATSLSRQVFVWAEWAPERNSAKRRAVHVGEVLRPHGGLLFDLTVNSGEPLPAGFSVQWRITNTGTVALVNKAGRGGFELPQSGNRRWEPLKYRGVHMAEAFVIRSSDGYLVGYSEPFYVVIE